MLDISNYVDYHKKQIEKYNRERRESIENAYKSLENVISVLKSKPSVKRIVLFGSLKNGNYIKGKSDIDIAVEGLSPSEYFSTCWEIEEKTGVVIDLFDLNPNNRSLYNIIILIGKTIYERP